MERRSKAIFEPLSGKHLNARTRPFRMTETVESDLSRAFKIVAVLKSTELHVLGHHFKDKLHDGMF